MKEKLIVLGMSLAILMACSESDSNGGVTQPSTGTITPNASKCDLATQKLPASSLAWQPTFSGGCEVQQQIALDDLQKFDALLIANSFLKEELTQESYRYVRKVPDYDAVATINDTLTFTYTMGTFAGNFSSKTCAWDDKDLQNYFVTSACPVLLPSSLFDGYNVCNRKEGNHKEDGFVYVLDLNDAKMTATSFASLSTNLKNIGWICTSKPDAVRKIEDIACSLTYLSQSYSLTYSLGSSFITGLTFKWVPQQ